MESVFLTKEFISLMKEENYIQNTHRETSSYELKITGDDQICIVICIICLIITPLYVHFSIDFETIIGHSWLGSGIL